MYRKEIYKKYLSTDNYDINELEDNFNESVHYSAIIKHNLPKDKNSKILDVGCGYGRFLNFLKSESFNNITGLEVGKEQCDFLKGKDIDLIETDLMSFLSNSNEKFDLITMFDVLEHFNKNEILIIVSSLKKRLNKSGILIIQVPNGEAIFKGGIMYGDFTHETFFTVRSLNQIFKLYDYSKINIYPLYPVMHGFFSLIRRIGFRVIDLFYKSILIFERGTLKGFVSTQNLLAIIKK